MKTYDKCDWAVCYDLHENGETTREVSAWFRFPFLAEYFIKKVLPDETRERFYIIHRDNM